MILRLAPAFTLALFASSTMAQQTPIRGTDTLPPALATQVDQAVAGILAKTGVPSAEVGLVQKGKIVYTAAYGLARLAPPLAAQPSMAYPIGSISKQFTASCLLLLQQRGKLSLEDPVARWFPELTRANEVTVKMLLSHTSGYSDYAPQDYTIPAWTHPIEPLKLVHEWAEKPLDFEPGTKCQYSNTNFVLAALIVEKASGMPFWTFLSTNVLQPLGLHDVLNLDTDRERLQVTGYMRHALAPLRPATLEASGWYTGDANLAMPVGELLRWDISILDQSLLSPQSYKEMETEVKLKGGGGTGYGLAVDVGDRNGHLTISHSGEVGGFVAQNTVLPDDGVALAVLTNQEAASAASQIAGALTPMLLAVPAAGSDAAGFASAGAAEGQARQILDGLERGSLDRGALSPDLNFYFSPAAVGDFQTSLKPLGPVTSLRQTGEALRGGMLFRSFDVAFGTRHVWLTTYTQRDGKLEQFLVERME